MDPHFGEPRPVGLSGNQAIPQPWNIYNFYAAPAKSGPWIPLNLVHTTAPIDQPEHPLAFTRQRAPHHKFLDYRGTGSPSDCATLPGDSGYGGSHPSYSTPSASAYGDDVIQDSQVGHISGECQISANAASFAPRRHAHAVKKFPCEECNAWLKSQGELKKHRQRHLKPHVCPYSGCSKSHQGFSTTNDLVRHKRSVHGEHDLPGRSFVCPHCSQGEKTPKIWPRADNFRSHLLRAHNLKLNFDDDHKDYLYQPAALRHDLQGVGTSIASIDTQSRPSSLLESPMLSQQNDSNGSKLERDQSARDYASLTAQMSINPALFQQSPDQRTVTSGTSEEDRYIYPAVLGESLGEPSQEYGTHQGTQYAPGAQSFSHVRPRDDCGTAKVAGRSLLVASSVYIESVEPTTKPYQESLKPDGSGSSESTQPGHDDISADMANLQQSSRRPPILDMIRDSAPGTKSNPSEIISYLKQFPKELLQTALAGESQDMEGGNLVDDERAPFDCEVPHCGKAFVRQCELKKHKKRHDKPYGCTFRSCSKRFGSKNDWKRHESSQHFQLETWNCDVSGCNKTYQRRESFKIHLIKDHAMTDMGTIDDKLEECRLGRHCDPRFWCGFCARVIEINVNESGGNSWTKRCDHIDNHLFGKDGLQAKLMCEWKHQDEETEAPVLTSTVASSDASDETPLIPESMARKRTGSTDANMRPRKRAPQTQTYMWTCCRCATVINLKTSSCCFDCGRQRCSDCPVEYVSSNADEASGEEEMDITRQEGRVTASPSRLEDEGYDM